MSLCTLGHLKSISRLSSRDANVYVTRQMFYIGTSVNSIVSLLQLIAVEKFVGRKQRSYCTEWNVCGLEKESFIGVCTQNLLAIFEKNICFSAQKSETKLDHRGQ